MNSSKILENAYYQEWAFVYGRKFLLTILAIGSLLVTHKIGIYIGNLLFPDTSALQIIVQLAFIFLGYAGIDWVLANALASASNVETDQDKASRKTIWIFAIAALASTLLLSLSSNFFISNEMAGTPKLDEFNNQVQKAMVQDSILKMQAFTQLTNATKEQNTLVKEAKREKRRLIQKAVNNGSASWQSDYQLHKNNFKAWFWVCTSCPKKYQNYRNNILAAIRDGDHLIYEAKNHKKFVQSSLSPTLSYQLSKDSLLISVKDNAIKLEEERKFREDQLNIILLVLTLGCAILALILTYVLKEHRKRYGQQVIENNVKMVMVIFDIFNRLGNAFTDLFYTVIVQPFNFLKSKGYIKSYELVSNRLTISVTDNGTNATVNKTSISVNRLCLNCSTDISDKRSDAKYCGDKCRMEYHNFVPHKRRNQK